MLFSSLASSLGSHSFPLGLALYLTCFPFGELSLLLFGGVYAFLWRFTLWTHNVLL